MTLSEGITVVTCAVDTRFEMLAENLDSVRAQTLQPQAHIICVDYRRQGPAATLNQAIAGVDTTWYMVLADDDILYPNCLEELWANRANADLVYPWCDVSGSSRTAPNQDFNASVLRDHNYIPATTLVRTDAWAEVGGYPTDVRNEDHYFFLRLLDAGKQIKCYPKRLWEYRIHGNNLSEHDTLRYEDL